jgi:hypothetical protein
MAVSCQLAYSFDGPSLPAGSGGLKILGPIFTGAGNQTYAFSVICKLDQLEDVVPNINTNCIRVVFQKPKHIDYFTYKNTPGDRCYDSNNCAGSLLPVTTRPPLPRPRFVGTAGAHNHIIVLNQYQYQNTYSPKGAGRRVNRHSAK